LQLPAPKDPVAALGDAFVDAVLYSKAFRDESTVVIEPQYSIEVLDFLRASPGLVYNMLSDVSAVDYYPQDYGAPFDGKAGDYRPERFAVSYHLLSMLYNRRLRVKLFVPEDALSLPSATGVYPAANWLEREIADMMGIAFEGHPDPRRLLMPEDWHGHPHRRDYPLGKETVAFSFNEAEIRRHKPFATN